MCFNEERVGFRVWVFQRECVGFRVWVFQGERVGFSVWVFQGEPRRAQGSRVPRARLRNARGG